MPNQPEFELDLAAWRARISPQRQALWFNGRGYTYAELDRRARELANRLRDLGVGRGDRVSTLALNHVVHIDLLLAAVKIGFVFAPIDPKLAPAEVRRLSQLIRPSLIFCDTRHQSVAETLEVPWTRLSDYAEWLAVGADSVPAAPQPPITADDTHLLLATSGITGPARLACLPYRRTLGGAARATELWNLQERDAALQTLPCSHASIGLVTLPLLHAGGTVVMMSRFSADEYIQIGLARQATLLSLAPAMFLQVTSSLRFEGFLKDGKTRMGWTAGGPCATPARWAFSRGGLPILPTYGLTEAGFHNFRLTPEEAEANPQCVGRPLPEVEARIVRPDGSDVEAGEVGELTLGGPRIFSGYFGDDDATRTHLAGGRVRTGDLFRSDVQGLYAFCGRTGEAYAVLDDQDQSHTVYPADVESAVLQCFGVVGCAAFSGAIKGESIVAVIVQEGAQRDAEQLTAELRPRLPAWQMPSRLLIVEALPSSEWGCVDRAAARRQFVGSGS